MALLLGELNCPATHLNLIARRFFGGFIFDFTRAGFFPEMHHRGRKLEGHVESAAQPLCADENDDARLRALIFPVGDQKPLP